ncbi:4-oxalocrotonate tautomerase DmpI [Calderihabitans maritimus]|uniref:4-oxalocrotonate tautomerase family enzyme n=1 Tax=Calderihabitans maritimus TaxID=1246530 RepID=A0A1Z5HS42_9FIRM|nr:4-oxalocrotonate tautomerase DmpI [Calderihabitans maritimus]GAW92343.1 4-oxalocrotonate tautomerase family enzyme [Calderihabitans maritimus]
MPLIIFEGPELTKEQKEKIAKEFTDTASKITGIPAEAFTVLLKENSPENVGIGGQLLVNKKK